MKSPKMQEFKRVAVLETRVIEDMATMLGCFLYQRCGTTMELLLPSSGSSVDLPQQANFQHCMSESLGNGDTGLSELYGSACTCNTKHGEWRCDPYASS